MKEWKFKRKRENGSLRERESSKEKSDFNNGNGHVCAPLSLSLLDPGIRTLTHSFLSIFLSQVLWFLFLFLMKEMEEEKKEKKDHETSSLKENVNREQSTVFSSFRFDACM